MAAFKKKWRKNRNVMAPISLLQPFAPHDRADARKHVCRPVNNYDRPLDFGRAVIGHLFFVPSATFLDAVSEGEPVVARSAAAPSGDGLPELTTNR
jgi:hypothetical protein